MNNGCELTMETAKKELSEVLDCAFENIRNVTKSYKEYFESHPKDVEEIKKWFTSEVECFKEGCLCVISDDPEMMTFSEFTEEIQKVMSKRLLELYDQYVSEGYDPEDVKQFILEECAPQMVDDFKTKFLEG